MSHPPPDRFHRHFRILYALEPYLYIPFALFTILLKYVRLLRISFQAIAL